MKTFWTWLFLLVSLVIAIEGQDTITIWDDLSDGFTVGAAPAKSCLANSYTTQQQGDGSDHIRTSVDKWHNGGLIFGCMTKNQNWQCTQSCFGGSNNPDFGKFKYLTFLAKNENPALDKGCVPAVSLTKRWPMYGSNVVNITDDMVFRKSLVTDEWRQVVIPTENFKTNQWPDLKDVLNLWFRSCGTAFSKQPVYKVAQVQLTNTPPSIGPDKIPIWMTSEDSISTQGSTCMTKDTPYSSISLDESGREMFVVSTDPWTGVGILLGCQGKDSNWNCNKSCFPWNGSNANFDDHSFILTFLAKVQGDFTNTCKPRIGLTGGGWPRLSSNQIALEGSYVDAGKLVSNEWRRVAIPLADLATIDWDLSNVFSLIFQSCGTSHSGAQPKYFIQQIELTDVMPELRAIPPVGIEYASHRLFHRDWFPIFGEGRDSKVWFFASSGQWPSNATSVPDHGAVIVIPKGQTITFTKYDTTKYDKVIVYGTLKITPDSSNVLLRPGTLVVEATGVVDISTNPSNAFTVTIEIDASLDKSDPQQTTVGILSLGGSMTVSGNPITTFMAPLSETARVGTSTVKIDGSMASREWKVGDEIVLPDTQQGLDVLHWNFPRNDGYKDQTEIAVISEVTASDSGQTILSLSSPLLHDHSIGAHVGHLTRSITFITAPTSVDRGHIMYTAGGKMDFSYVRLEQFGRTTTNVIDNTIIEDKSGLNFEPGLALMTVTHQGTNQLARYVYHAHHSLIESTLHGAVILYTPRHGCVHHDSRMHTTNNVIVGAQGSGIFLEDGTETGSIVNNFVIGTGGGSRGGDDGRFSASNGKDMGVGGFGIWARGQFAKINNNRAEGHFGFAPFAYFVHPSFIQSLKIPNVPGTPSALVDKSLEDVWKMLKPNPLNIQVYGSFHDNSAFGTWQVGLDLSYFSGNGSEFVGTEITALAKSGRQISTTHTSLLHLQGGLIQAVVPTNTIVGVWCNNGGPLVINYEDIPMVAIAIARGGNC